MKAVLGIGTNIGNRLKNIENVYSSLSLLPNTKIIKKSSVYETEPWGYEQQDRFLNCAVLIETELSPNALLGACLGIEAALGRVREFKNGPKFIRQRDFVLVPLHDLAPENNIFGYDFDKEYNETDKTKLTKQ